MRRYRSFTGIINPGEFQFASPFFIAWLTPFIKVFKIKSHSSPFRKEKAPGISGIVSREGNHNFCYFQGDKD
jgi:hypothetical protein